MASIFWACWSFSAVERWLAISAFRRALVSLRRALVSLISLA